MIVFTDLMMLVTAQNPPLMVSALMHGIDLDQNYAAGRLSALLQQGIANAWLFAPSAILLGALHGLEPGHSKTMMAAFIIAIKGTVGQAALLGLSATLSHTAIVWAVALIGLYYGSSIDIGANEGYFQIGSAVLIIGVALWMLLRTWRDIARERAADAPHHDHHHDDHHDHHHHRHGGGHNQGDHDQGGHDHHDETKRIDTGHGMVVLSVFEDGVPPRFRLVFEDNGREIPPPGNQTATLETIRPDKTRQVFTFVDLGTELLSVEEIPEPHTFTARLVIAHGNHGHHYDVAFSDDDHHDHSHGHGDGHGDGHTHGHGHTRVHPPAHVHAAHTHDHAHDHPHDHAHGTPAGLDLDTRGYQDAHELAHARDIRHRFADRTVTTGQIIIFGLTGGLIPCPASITVLLLCLQLKQISLGMALVLCFSIGLALTMVGVGAIAALSVNHVSRRWSGFGAIARRAPYLSSVVVIGVGIYVGYQGVSNLSLWYDPTPNPKSFTSVIFGG